MNTEPDIRYRILVLLGRTDRPTHYNFNCPRCTMKVAELRGTEVVAMSDAMDTDNKDHASIGVRCDGRYERGRCNIWYFFHLTGTQDREASDA